MKKSLRNSVAVMSLLGLSIGPSFAGTTVESLLNGAHIAASGSSQYFWGPLVSQNEISVGGSANNNFPLMYAGTTIAGNGGGGPYPNFCSPGPNTGPNVAIPPSLTPVNQWFCHDNAIPALPAIDFNHYKALAQSQGNSCGGHACYSGAGSSQFSGIYDPVCTVGADTKVWYFEGDVKFTGGTYFCGILISQGSINFSGSGAGSTVVAPPANAWQQYVVDTPAGSAHPQGDTAASDEYPGDAGLHAVKPYTFVAGGGGFAGKSVTFHGYLYTSAGYSTTGGNLIVGVVHQGPAASSSSGGGSTLFFEPQTVFTGNPPPPPANTVATPQIIPDGGNFIDPVRVSIIDSTPGAEIHYTLDGSIPTGSSPLYTGTFVLSTNTIVKAIGTLAGMNDSAVATAAFTFISVPHNPPASLTVTVIPDHRTLGPSQTQTFTASVTGTGVTNTKVTWSINPNVGTLTVNSSNQAIYTSPASITPMTVTLTAVALQDNFTKGTAAINLVISAPPPPVCGNSSCENDETCSTCSSDCGSCPVPPPVCGNNSCEAGETCTTCAADCGLCPPPPPTPVCGDASCNGTESCNTCSLDCGACPPPPPPVTCGNNTCDSGENCSSCSSDCGACPPPPPVSCGNNTCDSGESCSNCALDCGACQPPATCGNSVCDSGSGESCSNCATDCGMCPPPPPSGPVCGNNNCEIGESCSICAADCGACPTSAQVSRIVVSPASAMVAVGATRSFVAQAFDQNNNPMTGVSFSWSVTGSQNSMSPSSGLSSTFTAGMATGNFTVTASASGKSGTASVTVLSSGNHAGSTDISNARPHPVPYKSTSGLGGVTFSGLAPGTKIRIFSTDGRLVKTMHSDTGADVKWTVDNASGEKVSSSVYFYIIDNGPQTKKGKLVVIQ